MAKTKKTKTTKAKPSSVSKPARRALRAPAPTTGTETAQAPEAAPRDAGWRSSRPSATRGSRRPAP